MTTKDKILKSALKLFAKQGIDKTSTNQITKKVGIASGTLFVHFPTKQDLIDTLYLQIKKNAFSKLNNSFDPTLQAEKNVKLVSKTLIEHFLKNYNEFIFMGLVENDPQVSKKAIEAGRKEYEALSQVFVLWKKQNVLKKIPLPLIQDVLWNILLTIIQYCKKNKIKKITDDYLNIIWDAIKK